MSARILCLVGALLMIGFSLFGLSRAVATPEQQDQPVRIDVGCFKLNSVLAEPRGKPDLPPIVFVHGASANLYGSDVFVSREAARACEIALR